MHSPRNKEGEGRSQPFVLEMQPPSAIPNAAEQTLEEMHDPLTNTIILQQWNYPRVNMLRVFATFWSFIILGLNDASIGALIPYLEEYYGISYVIISLVFLGPVVGYIGSAVTNNLVHMHFGRRGVAAICAGAHLIAYIVVSLHPPYPVLIVVYVLAGYGNGLADSGW